MTIKVITGCLADDVLIDGESIDNISDKDFSKIVKKIVRSTCFISKVKLTKFQTLLAILTLYSPIEEDEESEPCEICRQKVSWKVYSI